MSSCTLERKYVYHPNSILLLESIGAVVVAAKLFSRAVVCLQEDTVH